MAMVLARSLALYFCCCDRSANRYLHRIYGATLSLLEKLAWVVVGIAIGMTACTKAELRWEGQAGACQFGQASAGTWHSDLYGDNDLKLTSPCFQLGASYAWHVRDWGIGIRGSFVDLGRFSNSGTMPADLDDPNLPKVYAEGSGQAYGPSLGGLVEWNRGNWTFGLEAGLFYYHSSWAWKSWEVGQTPNDTVTTWGGWQTTPYVGITARWKHLLATFRRYASITEHQQGSGNPGDSGLTYGPAYALLLGVSF